jgi:iron complex outermembrane receptor protein
VPAYAVLNLHTSYQVTGNIEVFGVINDALNQHYSVAGTFFDTGGFANVGGGAPLMALNDPRTSLPGMRVCGQCGREGHVLSRVEIDVGSDKQPSREVWATIPPTRLLTSPNVTASRMSRRRWQPSSKCQVALEPEFGHAPPRTRRVQPTPAARHRAGDLVCQEPKTTLFVAATQRVASSNLAGERKT